MSQPPGNQVTERRDSKCEPSPSAWAVETHQFHECPQKSQAFLVVQSLRKANSAGNCSSLVYTNGAGLVSMSRGASSGSDNAGLQMSLSVSSSMYTISSFESTPVGLADPAASQWVIVACSPAVTQMFNTTENELMYQPVENFVRLMDPPMVDSSGSGNPLIDTTDLRQSAKDHKPTLAGFSGKLHLGKGIRQAGTVGTGGVGHGQFSERGLHNASGTLAQSRRTDGSHIRISMRTQNRSTNQTGSRSLVSMVTNTSSPVVVMVCTHQVTRDLAEYWSESKFNTLENTRHGVAESAATSPQDKESSLSSADHPFSTLPNGLATESNNPLLFAKTLGAKSRRKPLPWPVRKLEPLYQIWFVEDVTSLHMLSAIGPPVGGPLAPLRQHLQTLILPAGQEGNQDYSGVSPASEQGVSSTRNLSVHGNSELNDSLASHRRSWYEFWGHWRRPQWRVRFLWHWIPGMACVETPSSVGLDSRDSYTNSGTDGLSRLTRLGFRLTRKESSMSTDDTADQVSSSSAVSVWQNIVTNVSSSTDKNLVSVTTSTPQTEAVSPTSGGSSSPIALFAGKPFVVFHMSEYGHILQCYPPYGNVLGRPTTSINSQAIFDFLHPVDTVVVCQAFARCAEISKKISRMTDELAQLNEVLGDLSSRMDVLGFKDIQEALDAGHSFAQRWQKQSQSSKDMEDRLSKLRESLVLLKVRWRYDPSTVFCQTCQSTFVDNHPDLVYNLALESSVTEVGQSEKNVAGVDNRLSAVSSDLAFFEWGELVAFPLFSSNHFTQFVCAFRPLSIPNWSTESDIGRCQLLHRELQRNSGKGHSSFSEGLPLREKVRTRSTLGTNPNPSGTLKDSSRDHSNAFPVRESPTEDLSRLTSTTEVAERTTTGEHPSTTTDPIEVEEKGWTTDGSDQSKRYLRSPFKYWRVKGRRSWFTGKFNILPYPTSRSTSWWGWFWFKSRRSSRQASTARSSRQSLPSNPREQPSVTFEPNLNDELSNDTSFVSCPSTPRLPGHVSSAGDPDSCMGDTSLDSPLMCHKISATEASFVTARSHYGSNNPSLILGRSASKGHLPQAQLSTGQGGKCSTWPGRAKLTESQEEEDEDEETLMKKYKPPTAAVSNSQQGSHTTDHVKPTDEVSIPVSPSTSFVASSHSPNATSRTENDTNSDANASPLPPASSISLLHTFHASLHAKQAISQPTTVLPSTTLSTCSSGTVARRNCRSDRRSGSKVLRVVKSAFKMNRKRSSPQYAVPA
ncbi:hypothetical protein IWQ61_003615 [Dispira simplex]|nr:hypothetical protein IWQ61_003615 [Dispira simplex]